MTRCLVEHRINDRAARARLEVRNRPYWRLVVEGFHLGYRRGARKGSWIVRLQMVAGANSYRSEALGQADDMIEANGKDVLSYAQALAKANRWKEIVEAAPAQGEAVLTFDGTLTIRCAIETYVAKRNARRSAQAGRTITSDAQYKLTAHVLGDKRLARIALKDLSEADLIAWQQRLVAQTPSSRQRVANDFKAALNAAYACHRRTLPSDLPTVIKYGLHIEAGEVVIARARENQILPDETVRSIVGAAFTQDEDFGRMVMLLAATGARFAQLRRMRVGDVQLAQGRLLVPQSFKGKRKTLEYIRMAVGADVMAQLRPIVEGRGANEPLLERWHLKQLSAAVWVNHERGEWKTPSELSRRWSKMLAHLRLPSATIPYALRHSSIVRGLRANLPIRLVAALHDTSVAMIERHYSRWITEGLEDMVARAIVPLVAAQCDARLDAA
jgi:integrase